MDEIQLQDLVQNCKYLKHMFQPAIFHITSQAKSLNRTQFKIRFSVGTLGCDMQQ